jgi:hypothetical protein
VVPSEYRKSGLDVLFNGDLFQAIFQGGLCDPKNVGFAPEGKTAHFGLAVSNRSRVAIWALSQFGYP